ncbi:MAG: bifunctional DNA primase/polymerase, partial [Phycisphaerales bacterium]|nr:bifunctional DNA primase/polymerase [Phycisphaerales bacterium]
MAHDQETLLRAARDYRLQGYAPTPLRAGTKIPRLSKWSEKVIPTEELHSYFNGTGNIGLMLGAPSGWLVDVDLDSPEAVEIAGRYLPPTPAVTGRRCRPGSHWW